MMKLPIFELFLQNDDTVGVALVDEPAIKQDFLYFEEEAQVLQFNDEKMIISGPALIPNQLIYRSQLNGYVYMSADTIFHFVQNFMKKREEKINVGHTDNFVNVDIIESYFAKESNEFNVPVGSWIITAKVNDSNIWNKIKENRLNGFSVEGLFRSELVGYDKFNNENMEKTKEKLLNFINQVLFNEEVAVETATVVEEVAVEETKVVEEAVVETAEIVEQTSKTDEIVTTLMNELKALKDELKSVNAKVEEYGKQPAGQSVVVEEVANTTSDKKVNKATQYFK